MTTIPEKKAKEAENQRRLIARKAREDHRRSLINVLKTESQIVGMMAVSLKKTREGAGKENLKPTTAKKPMQGLASKPSCNEDVVAWFVECEEAKGAGLDPKTQQVASYFHGQITRHAAETLLLEKGVGSYLVRLSEKIWGYAISYRCQDRCKHFLIDASEGRYQFFGTNQLSHNSLDALIEFHKTKPISIMGKEVLLHPVGQSSDPPDYVGLFTKDFSESSYL